jgi:non-ribosomal peptide synthetase component F
MRDAAPTGAASAVLAAWQVLLYRLTGQEEFSITVCAPAAAVPDGLSALGTGHTISVACRMTGHSQFGALMASADEALRSAAGLTQVTTPDAAPGGTPLCFAAGDLLLLVAPAAGHFALMCEYSADRFESATIRRWLASLESILDVGIAAPGRDIDALSWDRPAPAELPVCVHALVERHAARAPGDAALVFGDEVIEYGALDRKAAAVAHALAAQGVTPGVAVGVYLSRSAGLVTALLGIMKAGAVSVVLDPADPPARASAILEHSQAAVVITDSARRRQLPPSPLPIVSVDDAVASPIDGPAVAVPLEATACLVYACEACELRAVPVSHGTLAALLAGVRRGLSLTHEDVALAIAPPSLDVALIELLAPLSASGCVVIASDDVALDADRLVEAVGRSAATVLIAPNSIWSGFLAATAVNWPRLKAICFGGRPTPTVYAELVLRTGAAWFAHAAGDRTIWTTLHRLTEKDSSELPGTPLDYLSLRIVDGAGDEVPVGVPGHLLVRMAAGGTESGWTQTGEQARWRPDGELELVAGETRHAHIDGFRIDLNDVACAIRRHPAVADAEVVIESGTEADRLIACVVPRPDAAYSVSDLRRELRRTVPAAMVPRAFVEVGSIPRSADGRAIFEAGCGAPAASAAQKPD